MKKFLTLFFLGACAFALIVGYGWWKNVSSPANLKDTSSHDFLVTRGQSLTRIATNLEKEGLIKNKTVFIYYTRLSGQAGKIQAGEYGLSPSYSLDKIMMTLVAGPKELWVTYPEGLRREEMAAKTIQALNMDETRAQAFWADFISLTEGKEGYIFPETYLFGKDASANTVVSKMSNTFDTKVTEQMRTDAQKSSLSFAQLVTLASIVERESRSEEERPTVAGILFNRLKAKMPLQVDATLQYIQANKKCAGLSKPWECNWWQIPTSEDRTIRSQYNTYANPGLPPGPIANPSLVSIKAVIYPQDSPYYFYLHDAQGHVHYAKTGAEHETNIQKYLR